MSLCVIFDAISFYIDEVRSINPSANVFVFRYFNVHHKDWLTSSGETDRTDELFYNFSTSYDLNKMDNCRIRIPDCDSHSPVHLNLFLKLVLVLSSLSLHWKKLIMLLSQFLLTFCHTQKGMPLFTAQLIIIIVLTGSFRDHLRDDLWEDVFKLVGSGNGNEFYDILGTGWNSCIYPSLYILGQA